LLPFGRDGSKVEQIIASLQLNSVAASVQRTRILNNIQLQADLLFSGKLKSGFTKADPAPTIPAIEVRAVASGTRPAPKQALCAAITAPALPGAAPTAAGESRRAPRRNVLRAARISFGRKRMTCTIRNLSATGASIEGSNLAQVPDAFTLVLEMETAERPCVVVWRKKTRIGIRFG
ncbi:MAG: PilZ domain-containing protein, partial [Thiobacillus sp.]|nr:PilZ domain-containing protein [Thiobacillus sp.]